MKRVFAVRFQDDTFEVSMKGFVITRISCYSFGGMRQDMQFDDVPEEIQNTILVEVEKELRKEGY